MTFTRLNLAGALLATLAVASASQAGIISTGAGPTLRYGYHTGVGGGLDANATHYWSLDEASVPFADTGSSANLIPMAGQTSTTSVTSVLFSAGGVANNARRIGTSGSGANRITAFTNTTNTLADNLSLVQANSLYGSSGAITIDMLVRPDFDSSTHGSASYRLINEENDEGNPPNLFLAYNNQADVHGGNGDHVVEFHMGGTQLQATVPFAGDNALASGSWYHLAVIYTGDETATDNVKFYWTKVSGLLDATNAANLIGTGTIAADPPVLALRPEFTFGNETNGTSNKSWFGALDEIRISDIDRDPTGTGAGFIFIPEPTSVSLLFVASIAVAFCRHRRSTAKKTNTSFQL